MERARKSYAAKLLLASLLAVGSSPTAIASASSSVIGGNSVADNTQQQAVVTPQRLSPRLQRQLLQQPQVLQRVIISCDDAQALAATITAAGYEATAISHTLVTARIAKAYAERLSSMPGVNYLQAPRQAVTAMSTARPLAGVDRIHAGDGLDTPYTGRGVIVGVIDQGFEYKHLAFLDDEGKTRVRAIWNRLSGEEPTTDIPASGDRVGDIGHATFVTNVAAGSRIAENDFYGVAPEAEIIMVPSSLNEDEVLEDVQFISSFAEKEQKPWVINMSFGTQMGAHDGQSYFDQALNDVLKAAPGRQIIAAIGNDNATPIHIRHTIESGKETVSMLVLPVVYKGTKVNLWSQHADSLAHFTLRPFYLNEDGTRDYRDEAYWAERLTEEIAPYNRKQAFDIEIYDSDVTDLHTTLGIELSGHEGDSFDAWIESSGGLFTTVEGGDYLIPDNLYCVSEMGASARDAIAVASYVSTPYYTSLGSQTPTDWGIGEAGGMSTYSNGGPMADGTLKPDVAAPGGVINSAFAKTGVEWTTSYNTITATVRRGIRTYYYGASYGTSFATPFVTGIVALWLQANPNLTSEQIKTILQQTARHDTFTGDDPWHYRWGYGKVDAYEGLREALRLADETGITATRNATEPISISREGGRWRVLFGSNESQVAVSIYSLDGTLLSQNHYGSQQRGSELQLPLPTLRGTYVVTISTERARLTRKLFIAK